MPLWVLLHWNQQEREVITVLSEILCPGYQEEGEREKPAWKACDPQINCSTLSEPLITEKAEAVMAQSTES